MAVALLFQVALQLAILAWLRLLPAGSFERLAAHGAGSGAGIPMPPISGDPLGLRIEGRFLRPTGCGFTVPDLLRP